MAEEPQYASEASTNKRKYEDSAAALAAPRRQTGFSAPIASPQSDPSHGGPPAYNNAMTPADDIEKAKQRAQEIAARIYNSASGAAGGGVGVDVKRARVENGDDKGFGYAVGEVKPQVASAVPLSYGFQGTSKKIDIPNNRVGVIIGKGGETIKYLQQQSGAKIQVTRDMDADPNSATRPVELMGTPEQIARAEGFIKEVLQEAENGGAGIVSRRLTGQAGSDQFVMKIPDNKVGLVIGKGGETIKNMQARSGARIQVIPLHKPPGDTSTERTVQIDGTTEQIESAKQLVNEVINENRLRNPSMTGAYPQQGYQARPPTNWAPPGAPPMQQPGYGYMQPGAYPGPSPQYNMAQPPYAGYPPQPTSGGYPTNWDQSTVPTAQQNAQGGGYDYYAQQPAAQQQAPGGHPPAGDNTGYNYNQPPATAYNQQGPGYPQDGYSGYQAQSAYGQPPPYDQHQGYSSATGYGGVANPPNSTQEGHTSTYAAQGDSAQAPPGQPSSVGQQGYGSGQQPSPNLTGYPQGSTQPGYGIPPNSQNAYGSLPPTQPGYGPGYGPPQAQKPPATTPAYGQQQPQQSPSSTPGGYGQPPVQPSYPHSQPPPSGYAQPDSGQLPPASSYGAATAAQQPYGPPSYGAPPANQPGYGQAPPPYNSSYGSGYSQPAPVYPSDGSAGAAPASQAVQQAGVAKASPQS